MQWIEYLRFLLADFLRFMAASLSLMRDLSHFERALKERKIVGCRAAEAFGELKTVVGLNALDGKAELLKVIEHMNQKLRRGVGTFLRKSFKATVS